MNQDKNATPEPLMFADRDGWRAWLEANHDKSDGIWLAYYKKDSGKASVTYEEAVEEAICFGWIDSQVNAIDDERYMQRYTPRKQSSVWSESNKERVIKMVEQGRMTEFGMAAVLVAQKGGHWDDLKPVENLEVPPELETALEANPEAAGKFNGLSESHRKQYLYWIHSAKTDETRKKRVKKSVKMLLQGKTPGG
ncbi:MAG: YdeI/OmpD-associated family protein [Syntrophales bacterium]|nr:YdeI/OmpD-associated family protein [Syntrophales bacterium]